VHVLLQMESLLKIGGRKKNTSLHYKVLFITKSIMETEYDILMTAIRLQ
jgi:hypothetical protein